MKIAWIRMIDIAGDALIQDGSPVGSPRVDDYSQISERAGLMEGL